MIKTYRLKPFIRSLIAFLILDGGGGDLYATGLNVEYDQSLSSSATYDVLTVSNNATLSIVGADGPFPTTITVEKTFKIDSNSKIQINKARLILNGKSIINGQIELENNSFFIIEQPGQCIINESGSISISDNTSNIDILGNLNLMNVEDLSWLINIGVHRTGILFLPENCDTYNQLTIRAYKDSTIYLKATAEAIEVDEDGLIKINHDNIDIENIGINFQKLGDSEEPINLYYYATISDIAKSTDANQIGNVLDITKDVEGLNPIIDNENTSINFTVLTTPSNGISIAEGASISGTLNIKLDLGGE